MGFREQGSGRKWNNSNPIPVPPIPDESKTVWFTSRLSVPATENVFT